MQADWWASPGSVTLPVRFVLETITVIATLTDYSWRGAARLALSFFIQIKWLSKQRHCPLWQRPSLLPTLQGCCLVLTGNAREMMETENDSWLSPLSWRTHIRYSIERGILCFMSNLVIRISYPASDVTTIKRPASLFSRPFGCRLPDKLLLYLHIQYQLSRRDTRKASVKASGERKQRHLTTDHTRIHVTVCQDQEVDPAATTLINLSTAWQQRGGGGGGGGGDRDWGADTLDIMLSWTGQAAKV